jgi:hypothetical protein
VCTERKLRTKWRSPTDTPSLSPTVVAGLLVRYSIHRSSPETFFSPENLFVNRFVLDERPSWTEVPPHFLSRDISYLHSNVCPMCVWSICVCVYTAIIADTRFILSNVGYVCMAGILNHTSLEVPRLLLCVKWYTYWHLTGGDDKILSQDNRIPGASVLWKSEAFVFVQDFSVCFILASKGGFTHTMLSPAMPFFPIWFTQCGHVWFTHAMEWHVLIGLMRESNTAAQCKSNGKDTI